jgi:hypothetical protein
MAGFELTMKLDDVIPETIRQIAVPSDITFKKMHEIIALTFNLDINGKYKYKISDLDLEIKDTGKLNRDTIDSRYEKVDKYFEAVKKVYYKNDFWRIIIETKKISYDKDYPQIIGIVNYYNPSPKIQSPEDFSNMLKFKKENQNKFVGLKTDLKRVTKIELQENLMLLFNVPYSKDRKSLHEIKKEDTLENYL